MGSGGAAKSGGMISQIGKGLGQAGALMVAKQAIGGMGQDEEPRGILAPNIKVNYT